MSNVAYTLKIKNLFMLRVRISSSQITQYKRLSWLITNTPQSSSLNENSFCTTEKENLLVYSLTINGNYAETKEKES